MVVIRHIGQKPCICSDINPRYSFASQIITIPFLWHLFPNLRQVCVALILFDGFHIFVIIRILRDVLVIKDAYLFHKC